MHLAPMGPTVDAEFQPILLRPFPGSQTCRNLLEHRQGVFHVIDDVLLLARSAVGRLAELPATFAAHKIQGFVLQSACQWFEFQVCSVDTSQERVHLDLEVVHRGRLRDFIGFNRAKNVVLEAAILATRVELLDWEEIQAEYHKWAAIVRKTGGPREIEAFAFLEDYLAEVRAERRREAP